MKTGEDSYVLLDSMEEGEHTLRDEEKGMVVITVPVTATITKR